VISYVPLCAYVVKINELRYMVNREW
jgi:hypothetical protein